jgi:hypothetical protein
MSNAIDADAVKTLVANIDSTSSADGNPTGTIADGTNTFEITIQRTVAKARVTYASSATLTTADSSGTLANVKYLFVNVNRAVYPFQYLGLGIKPNPTPGSLTAQPQSPYYEASYSGSGNMANWKNYYYNYPPVSDLVVMAADGAPSATSPAYYVTENTQQYSFLGNTTAVAVEGVFQPAGGRYIIGSYEGSSTDLPNDTIRFVGGVFTIPSTRTPAGSLTTLPTDADGKQVLYQVRGGRGATSPIKGIADSMFFTNKLTAYKIAYLINCVNAGLTGQLNNFNATNYKKAPTGFTLAKGDSLSYDIENNNNPGAALVAEFTDAKCYYSIRFIENEIPGVKRNHYYQFKITEFKGLGRESLEDVNRPTDNPVGPLQETHITATLKIDPWRVVASSVIPD